MQTVKNKMLTIYTLRNPRDPNPNPLRMTLDLNINLLYTYRPNLDNPVMHSPLT